MGKFIISKRVNGEFQFNLQSDNGQVILTSEGYSTKDNCKNGIESVRSNSQIGDRYDRKISANEKHYFNLKAANNQIIGTSQMYESAQSRDAGIDAVIINAPAAVIEDNA